MHTCAYACVCMCVYVFVNVCMCLCVGLFVCECVCVCMCAFGSLFRARTGTTRIWWEWLYKQCGRGRVMHSLELNSSLPPTVCVCVHVCVCVCVCVCEVVMWGVRHCKLWK